VKAVFESCSPVVMCMFDLGSLLMMMMMTLWPCLPLKPKLSALLIQSLVFVVDHQQRIASGVYILIVESKCVSCFTSHASQHSVQPVDFVLISETTTQLTAIIP